MSGLLKWLSPAAAVKALWDDLVVDTPGNRQAKADADRRDALLMTGIGNQTTALAEHSAALKEQTGVARESAAQALAAQQAAAAQLAAASRPPGASESVRQAAEARMRRLLTGTSGLGQKLIGEAPVGYRILTGA